VGRAVSAVPWENRATIGTIEAYGQTVWRSISAPSDFFNKFSSTTSSEHHTTYKIINLAICAITLAIIVTSRKETENHDIFLIGEYITIQTCLILSSSVPLAAASSLMMDVLSAILSLTCGWLGGSQGDHIGATRGVSYTTGPLVVMAAFNVVLRLLSLLDTTLPGVTDVCATVGTVLTVGTFAWITALVVLALRAVHRLSTGRAIAAIALVLGSLAALLLGAYGAIWNALH